MNRKRFYVVVCFFKKFRILLIKIINVKFYRTDEMNWILLKKLLLTWDDNAKI